MSDLLNNDDIQTINIEETLQNSYLDYSMSVIVGRALPDVRDGLKPVHRRILYAMDKLNLSYGAKFKKSARIVGDVIGQYHPHGDTAVYDALVRMAQDFSMRMQLVDGQGNFGSVDGDSAAAMRYTEARMTKYAGELLKDLDKNTVNMIENYDGTTKEPDVMPTRVPNLLINGSSGIAVGMATNIPPHNPTEIMNGLRALLANPNITLEEIMEHIKAPDFPTGGIIFGKKGITEAYESGRGRIKVRAKTHIEQKAKKEVIVIDELPYQVNKSALVKEIAKCVREKVVEGISNLRDESDRAGLRIVLELKRDAPEQLILNKLYKNTRLEIGYQILLLAIKDGAPQVLSMKDILQSFIDFRRRVIIRRSFYELKQERKKAHILEGLKKAIDQLERVIALIRTSPNNEEAKKRLIGLLDITEIQATEILNLRLARLTGIEREKLVTDLDETHKKIAQLEKLLASETLIKEEIKRDIIEIRDKYGDDRRTEIIDTMPELNTEDFIEDKEMVVTTTLSGYIKRTSLDNYRAQRRGGKGLSAMTTKEEDFVNRLYTATAHDTLYFFTTGGLLFSKKVWELPKLGRNTKGIPMINLLSIPKEEKIASMIAVPARKDFSFLFVTSRGYTKRLLASQIKRMRTSGLRVLTVEPDDFLVDVVLLDGSINEVLVVSRYGKGVRFKVDEVRTMGRTARGVIGIRIKNDKGF